MNNFLALFIQKAYADFTVTSTATDLNAYLQQQSLETFKAMMGFMGVILGIIVVFAIIYNILGFNR